MKLLASKIYAVHNPACLCTYGCTPLSRSAYNVRYQHTCTNHQLCVTGPTNACYIISKWQDIVDEAMFFLSPQPIVFHEANDVNVIEAEAHIIDVLSSFLGRTNCVSFPQNLHLTNNGKKLLTN